MRGDVHSKIIKIIERACDKTSRRTSRGKISPEARRRRSTSEHWNRKNRLSKNNISKEPRRPVRGQRGPTVATVGKGGIVGHGRSEEKSRGRAVVPTPVLGTFRVLLHLAPSRKPLAGGLLCIGLPCVSSPALFLGRQPLRFEIRHRAQTLANKKSRAARSKSSAALADRRDSLGRSARSRALFQTPSRRVGEKVGHPH
jgi:hypothetical protein